MHALSLANCSLSYLIIREMFITLLNLSLLLKTIIVHLAQLINEQNALLEMVHLIKKRIKELFKVHTHLYSFSSLL